MTWLLLVPEFADRMANLSVGPSGNAHQVPYHWNMISVETAVVYIKTTVVMMIRMSLSSAIGNMRR